LENDVILRRQVMFRKTILVVLVLGTVPAARANLVDSNSIIQDGIEYYIQTDKFVYDLGENVEIVYRVTNLRDEEWRVDGFFPIRDIIVTAREGEVFNEIWNWSWDKFHHMGPIFFQLEPGEAAEISGVWPQIDLNGSVYIEDHTQVPPGIYRTIGIIIPTHSIIAVDITIIPEPATSVLLGLGFVKLLIRSKKRKH
jgi:hypothetical protein